MDVEITDYHLKSTLNRSTVEVNTNYFDLTPIIDDEYFYSLLVIGEFKCGNFINCNISAIQNLCLIKFKKK